MEERQPEKRVGSAGRPAVSPRTKRAKARDRQRRYRETHSHKTMVRVRLSAGVSCRWVEFAKELNVDNNALATLLLDMFHGAKVTSPVTSKLPSTSTPAVFTHGKTLSTDTSLLVSPVYGEHRSDDEEMLSSSSGSRDGSVAVEDQPGCSTNPPSVMSGIIPLRLTMATATSSRDGSVAVEDQPGCSTNPPSVMSGIIPLRLTMATATSSSDGSVAVEDQPGCSTNPPCMDQIH